METRGSRSGAGATSVPNSVWVDRSGTERRSNKDKRRADSRIYFFNGGAERRKTAERRQPTERRDGWLRVGKWRSVSIFDD
jgi:hypothetical protein